MHACVCTQFNTVCGGMHRVALQTTNTQLMFAAVQSVSYMQSTLLLCQWPHWLPTSTFTKCSYVCFGWKVKVEYYTQTLTSSFKHGSCVPRHGCLHTFCGPCLGMHWTVPETTFSHRLEHGWQTMPEQAVLGLSNKLDFGVKHAQICARAPSVKRSLHSLYPRDWRLLFLLLWGADISGQSKVSNLSDLATSPPPYRDIDSAMSPPPLLSERQKSSSLGCTFIIFIQQTL